MGLAEASAHWCAHRARAWARRRDHRGVERLWLWGFNERPEQWLLFALALVAVVAVVAFAVAVFAVAWAPRYCASKLWLQAHRRDHQGAFWLRLLAHMRDH